MDTLWPTLKSFLDRQPDRTPEALSPLVSDFLSRRRQLLLKMASARRTPFYVFDPEELEHAASSFLDAFRILPSFQPFYAVKSNSYPGLLKALVRRGFGLDVSSGKELTLALSCGAEKIVFSGPGKTNEEMGLALRNASKVTLHLDSFRELEKAGEKARALKTRIQAGVRIFTPLHGVWDKFGIPLHELRSFWDRAHEFPEIELQGIQCHMSWNESAEPYQKVLTRIAEELGSHFSPRDREGIRFIDFGGGFWPQNRDGVYSWATPQGEILKILGEHMGRSLLEEGYTLSPSVPLSDYASGIAQAIATHLSPLVPACRYFSEPGRILCNNAMHVLLRVEDVKRPGMAILDGGYNIMGWEKLRNNYGPLVNLTHPSAHEVPFKMYGSLCQADDIWGHTCYAERIEEGDIIAAPFQGAYTYSLMNTFIKPSAKVYVLRTRPPAECGM